MIIQSIDIPNALRLDFQTVDNLIKGDIIAAIPRTFTNAGRIFALYPDQPDTETVTISAWARCEQCDIVDDSKPLDIISHYTAISIQRLQEIITERESFFLIYLRVYRLSNPITIPARSQGQYVALPDRLKVDDSSPVLSDRDFTRLKRQLENLEPPEPLDVQIRRVLKEIEIQRKMESLKKFDWIKEITTKGDRSIEEDKSKSNYQAGTEFEIIVKQSLEFLGFTVDITHKGGAGGLDLFCSKPYPVAGECKAGRSKSDKAVEQIDRIAKRILKENYLLASGLIILGSGDEPSNQLVESAISSKVTGSIRINIIKAMTLQKLVELKAKYDGAIDLFELKKCLQGGQIDEVIDTYIQKVEGEINLRSHIVNLVKNNHEEKVGVETLFGAYPYSNPPRPIREREELKDLLIELSSPLAGYLGRVEENGKKCDRFYYLRDLPCNT
jgi:hypothetical protein